jgi:hypothetical protein
MDDNLPVVGTHPVGEPASVEDAGAPRRLAVDTFAGRVHLEWDPDAAVTPLGQLPFFTEYLKLGGLFDAWVADCPLSFSSPNAPKKRDVLGTTLLSILAGHWRYAHITSLRGDRVNPALLGMRKVVSEDAVRRAFQKIDEPAGVEWLQRHLDDCISPLLCEPWILDVDTTIKPLYGHQQGAVVSYNPHKPGRPSHSYHTYMVSNLRLALDVEVQPGNRHHSAHSAPALWSLLERLGRDRWPWLLRGDRDWGTEANMSRAEAEGLPYLFKLRLTKRVKRLIEKAMGEAEWCDGGQGWQGKEARLRLMGWSRHRRVVILRRRLRDGVAVLDRGDESDQLRLSFAEVVGEGRLYEYAVLVTSLPDEILTLAQLYRDRADCENNYDELKNHWGWGGFTTQDLKRCRLMARCVALTYNWWSLFVRLADPDQHTEAVTSRPLLLHAVGQQTQHAGQTTITITSQHGKADKVRQAFARIAAFFRELKQTAEQLTDRERWYRILSRALSKYLKGRQLRAPPRLQAA